MTILQKYIPFFFGGLILAFCFLFSGESLRKGQVIKQFHTVSISRSLFENSFHILDTKLPCPDPQKGTPKRRWVEEPPLFHSLSALAMTIGIDQPIFFPLGVWTLLATLIYQLLLLFPSLDFKQRNVLLVLALTTPISLRYSIQNIPDVLAAVFLIWGAIFIFKRKIFHSLLLLMLAVTTKALTLFPATALLFWAFMDRSAWNLRSKRTWVGLGVSLVCVTLPFFIWIAVIFTQHIPNPFVVHNWIENRHSGSLKMLVDLHFWLRFLTWVGPKGVGVILFLSVGAATLKKGLEFCKPFSWGKIKSALQGMEPGSREGSFLWVWSSALVPYWGLVRAGNFVHDHYFLPFFVPIAMLGGRELWRLKNRAGIAFFICLSIGQGGIDLMSLKPIPEVHPHFCSAEQAEKK